MAAGRRVFVAVVASVAVLAAGASPAAEAGAAGASTVRFGIWFPYVSNVGVPPVESLAAAGVDATFLSGDIDANVLASYDVLFFGRASMIGFFPAGAGVIQDIDALIDWVRNGGGVIGESNALLWDSDVWRGTDWSSRLSVVAGISAPRQGFDIALSNLPVSVVDATHPVTEGVSAAFTLLGSHAHMVGTVVDNAKNPTTVAVAQVLDEPVSVAAFGAGCAVNFPTAVGFGGMDWAANPDYERLFINAVLFCGGGRVIEVEIDIKPGNDPNSIKLSNRGVIPVAILSTTTFDATTVDPSTVCFGDAEDAGARNCTEAHDTGHIEDANGDLLLDVVLHYETGQTGIDFGDTQACLTGQTFGGQQVAGCDSVQTLDP